MTNALGSAARYALLAAFVLLNSAPASARTDGWDAVIDLDRETSCRPIVAALQPLLEGKASTRFVKVTGSLTGTADAISVPVLYRTGGARPGPPTESPIRACIPLIPTTRAGYFRGAPVADGSPLNGVLARIHFENVELRVRCEQGQSRDFVALFLGGGWLAGFENGSHEYAGGTISGGVVLSGLLRVQFEGDCDGGLRAGSPPQLRPRSFLSERGTARAVMFVNGLMRSISRSSRSTRPAGPQRTTTTYASCTITRGGFAFRACAAASSAAAASSLMARRTPRIATST